MQFRLTWIASVIFLTGCAAEPVSAIEEKEAVATSVSPFVGTWRWSGSGTRYGTIELGEEHYVFRADGTYTVVSKSGDGEAECHEGTFAWKPRVNALREGTMVFNARYERETYLDEHDALHFGPSGTYVRTDLVITTRCPVR